MKGKTIAEEHKKRLKDLIASYLRDPEEDNAEAYFAVGFTFVEKEEPTLRQRVKEMQE